MEEVLTQGSPWFLLQENKIGTYLALYMRENWDPFGYTFRFMYMQTNCEGEWAPRVSTCEEMVWNTMNSSIHMHPFWLLLFNHVYRYTQMG